MLILYYHAAPVILGLLLMTTGMVVARTMKQKRWWLNAHRVLGITGALILWGGAVMATVLVSRFGGQHFNIPHAFVGLAAAILAMVTPVAGQMQLRIRNWALKLRIIHRWSGRLVLILAGLNAVLGLLMLQ